MMTTYMKLNQTIVRTDDAHPKKQRKKQEVDIDND